MPDASPADEPALGYEEALAAAADRAIEQMRTASMPGSPGGAIGMTTEMAETEFLALIAEDDPYDPQDLETLEHDLRQKISQRL